MERPAAILVIAHADAAAAAVAALNRDTGDVDLLVFGRAADGTPTPDGVRRFASPLGSSKPATLRAAISLVLAMRGRRYDLAAIGLSTLGSSQSRGALLGLAWIARARESISIDPLAPRETKPFKRRMMLLDALRYACFRAGVAAASRVVAVGLRGLSRLAHSRGPDLPATDGGGVVYLRTDIELREAPLTAGGSLSHTLGILRALRRRGHELQLLSTGEMRAAKDEAQQTLLPVVAAANVPREFCEFLSGLRQGLGRLPSGPAPAFVYQRHSMNNFAGVLMARRWGVPLVLEANASEVKWRRGWGSLRLASLGTACEKLILRDAARVAAVSGNAAADLLDAGASPDRLRVVPNGVDVDRFAAAKPVPLPFDDDAFVIGFAGLFYRWHGVRHLAEAFSVVLRARPSARLLLVGDGEDAPLVADLLKRAGIGDEAVMTGLVEPDEVPGYLRACDVLASPHAAGNDFIGSPIKIWEYMATGRAMVASDLAQMGEVLDHERTALLVPPAAPAPLADALIRLHDNVELRERLGGAAQAEAREKHSWDSRLAQTLA